MIKILVNDGMHPDGQSLLEQANYQVDTDKVAQEDLPKILPDYDVILVRSATKVRQDLIDQCPNLKIIGRGGVGLDNIDVNYAKEKSIEVINTPAASSQAVAELVFAHMFSLSRFLYKANREMPEQGNKEFKNLKKAYSKGVQLRGKTIGILGFGRIGQETAKIGLGMGMNVLAVDPFIKNATVSVELFNKEQKLDVNLKTVEIDYMLANADYISLHIPSLDKPAIGMEEFSKMKEGVFLVNASRGGMVDEDALLEALNKGIVAGAGLDVFENEPTPLKALLEHPRVSLSPHIGASTMEAQRNIGLELAEKIIAFFNN